MTLISLLSGFGFGIPMIAWAYWALGTSFAIPTYLYVRERLQKKMRILNNQAQKNHAAYTRLINESKQLKNVLNEYADKANAYNQLYDDHQALLTRFNSSQDMLAQLRDEYIDPTSLSAAAYEYAGLCWERRAPELFNPYRYRSDDSYRRWIDSNATQWSQQLKLTPQYSNDQEAFRMNTIKILKRNQNLTQPRCNIQLKSVIQKIEPLKINDQEER